MRRIILASLATFALSGCVSTTTDKNSASSSDGFANLNDSQICIRYYNTKDPTVRKEIERRKIIPSQEWEAIESEDLRIGMSFESIPCAWGAPHTVNTTETANGHWVQVVYRDGSSDPARYVYTDGHKITALQNFQ